MNKVKIMSELVDLLDELMDASYGHYYEFETHKKPILDLVEAVLEKYVKADQELPRTDLKAWTLEFETAMELNLTIKADLCKGHPGSYWEPPEPASIEDMEIQIEGCGITQTLFDRLSTIYMSELEEQIWDEAEVMEKEHLQAEAEHRMAAAEHRKDLEEGR